jgi:alpha-tubulin suppressor-like RCC1 family protein
MNQVNAAVAAGTWTGLPQLYSWGQNNNGQLGLGNTTNYSSPKQVGALTTWSVISKGGSAHFVLIKTDGTLWSWGNNLYGQLGLGNTTYYSSPKQVGALTTWSKINCGTSHTLAIKTDGTLWSWGYNNSGRLGLGNATDYSSPKQVGALTTWSNITGGIGSFSLATKTDGTLWSWGLGFAGALGLGNTTNYSSPKQVGALTAWLNVASGVYHSLATKTDGTLWSWGYNPQGQLGLNSATYAFSSPNQIGALTTWSTINCGKQSSIAIKTDGTLWNWGLNSSGQLGLGNTTNYSSPKQVGALTTWLNLACGNYHTLVTKTDGTLWSWGNNASGQLGLGSTASKSSPNQVGTLTTWLKIASGSSGAIAIKTS